MKFKTIDDFKRGDKASITKTITETDVYLFAGISGDFNPAHTNEEYMKTTHFRHRVAHGMLTMALLSAVIGVRLPGPGAVLLSARGDFVSPVYFGDTITAQVEVIEKNHERNRMKLEGICTNQSSQTVLKGEFLVSPYVKKIGI